MPARNEKNSERRKYKRHMFVIQTYKVQTSVNDGLQLKIGHNSAIHPYPSSQMYNDNPQNNKEEVP